MSTYDMKYIYIYISDLPSGHTGSQNCQIKKQDASVSVIVRAFHTKVSEHYINLLKPTGHVMHQQFNIQ